MAAGVLGLAALIAGPVAGNAATTEPTPAGVLRAASVLARDLGRQGVVDVDHASGRPRVIARLDGYLTGPSTASEEDVVRDYLRDHPQLFGLDADDLAGLGVARSYVSRGRVRRLVFEQRVGGVPVLDGELVANVTTDGRLVNVLGAPLPDVPLPPSPSLLRSAARARAAGAVDGSPAAAAYPSGQGTELVLLDGRLAWRSLVEGPGRDLTEVVLDDASGAVVSSRSFRRDAAALVFDYYPGAPLGGTQRAVEIAPYVTTPGGPRLQGPYAIVSADEDDDDVIDAGEDIPPSAGTDYSYAYTPFPTVAGVVCPPAPTACSWDRNQPFSWRTNRNQAAVQAFYHVNVFRDHVRNASIEFTPAKGGFEGASRYWVDVADGAAIDNGLPDFEHRNNAYNYTPPTGAGALTFLLFTEDSTNTADDAFTVYHEYAHGLSSRLVSAGRGLLGLQADAMGEAWSDWYAADFLSLLGHAPDGPASGEIVTGRLGRSQPLDCPVGSAGPACPGSPGAGPGGYTYGDLGRVIEQPETHADGEIWAETLWDLRSRLIARHGTALGIAWAELLVTAGMELSPGEPSFLDMRNAILEADLVYGAGSHYDLLWEVFAARGMGWFAAAVDSRDVHPVESFATVPPAGGPIGNLAGRVLDEAGVPVPGARVTVAGLRGYADAVADAEGRWSITGMDVGVYPRVFARAGGGLDDGVAVDVPVTAGATTNRDIVMRRDWAAYAGGARVTQGTGPYTDTSGCGPSNLLDQDAGSAWRTDSPAKVPGEKTVTIRLAEAVDVMRIEIDPTQGCGVGTTAMLGTWRLEVSRDGTTFTPVGEGTFGLADAFRRNAIPIAGPAAFAVRHVRLVAVSSRDSSNPEFTGARSLAVTDLAVYGTRADVEAPDTSIAGGPADGAVLASRDATFAVTASESGARFECRLDGGAWAACPGSAAYAGLAEGRHVFEARAADAAGNVDTSPAGRSWTVDATPPETGFLGGPPEGGRVRVRTARLMFASEPGATFQCRVDGGEWRACTTPLALDSLVLGPHVVAVRALDAAGNVDATPAERAWRVAPTTASYTLTLPRLRAVAALRVRYTCPNACRLVWTLTMRAPEARRLRLGSGALVLARVTTRRATAGSGVAVLPLGRRVAGVLRQERTAALVLSVTGVEASPKPRTLVLRR